MTETTAARILIADDEPLYLRTTGQLLRQAGYECVCVEDGNAALRVLQTQSFDLILSDLNMPGNLKLEMLQHGRKTWPHIPLIVITGVPSLPTAIESVRLGIADYLLKPVKYEDLLVSIRRVLSQSRNSSAASTGSIDRPSEQGFPHIIGQSGAMREVLDVVRQVAGTDTNVLISGESGTGKEIIAQAIHDRSDRREACFQVIDCTAIPESLFESVLFGHRKGSFTGAVRDQDGLLSQSDQGTAFFDELGELPLASQAKLLRAVQEQSFTPVGSDRPIQIQTRYLSATNRDLQAEVQAGRFREDLFYRLSVIHLELPPLRERGDDVLLLADAFLERFCPPTDRPLDLSDEVRNCFLQYQWPGNIRELRNVIERAVALTRTDTITMTDLPTPMREPQRFQVQPESGLSEISREKALDEADQTYLRALLQKHKGNISQAARQAGLSRQGMHKLISRHGMDPAEFRS